jgi:hypothetical protein
MPMNGSSALRTLSLQQYIADDGDILIKRNMFFTA